VQQHIPLKTFIIYAKADKLLKDEMLEFLEAGPIAGGLMELWHDADIQLGEHWDATIKEHLSSAKLILILVSVKSINSTYINHTELKIALQRGLDHEAKIVPIFLKAIPEGSQMLATLKTLQGLSFNKPVGLYNLDEREIVWADIANQISKRIRDWKPQIKSVAAPPVHTQPTVSAPATFVTPPPKPPSPQLTPEQKFIAHFDYPLITVEGDSFRMGSPGTEENRRENECQHKVLVDSFQIGKYPVTQEQWQIVMGTNPSHFKHSLDCPVEKVSWDDVQKFIKVLNAKTGLTYRLPTEQEWEYAARGGNKSKGYIYSGSNNLDEVARHNGNSDSKTQPVGTRAANELGIHDMSGNVWEWCDCLYQSYPCDPEQNAGVSYRVFRGGSWYDDPQGCRVANRYYFSPGLSNFNLGFRLARTN
jgi:formylglycine-generating enzyme required for sulfatase activity